MTSNYQVMDSFIIQKYNNKSLSKITAECQIWPVLFVNMRKYRVGQKTGLFSEVCNSRIC